MILADLDALEAAKWTGIGTLITGVIVALTTAIIRLSRNRHQIKTADEATALQEYRKVVRFQEGRINKLEKRLDEQEEETAKLRIEHQECLLDKERMKGRLEACERALEMAGIQVYRPEPETDS